MVIPPFVPDALERLGMEIPPILLERLAHYLDFLLEANKRFNLTGIRDRDEAWRRHIIDSLTILPGLDDLPEGAAVVDVGSGGGLPGVPIAIARPDLRMTLLESTGKKAQFLRQCIEGIALERTIVLNDRAEHVGQNRQFRQQFDGVICRALGPMNELLEYTLPLAKVGGRLLVMKGPSVQEELTHAGDALDILGAGAVNIIEAYPEGFDIHTVIVVIAKDRPTPKPYPRLPGVPRQSPL